mgnify:CR=1 FL=1|jgi:hypothetical protein
MFTIFNNQGVVHDLVEAVSLRVSEATHKHVEVEAAILHHGHTLETLLYEQELVSAIQC